MTDHYDVIVIGSGAGGGTLTHALAPTGKRILLLERGGFLPREPQNWDSKSVWVDLARHSMDFWLTTEDLPLAENQVLLGRDGRIRLRYTQTNAEAHQRLIGKFKGLLDAIQCRQDVLPGYHYLGGRLGIGVVAHQNGTVRFGTDPATSALDINCKLHELGNVYVADSSFFCSSTAVNPTLTIIANALRVADHIAERLGATAGEQAQPALTHSTPARSAGTLLLAGGCIWAANVLVFALWYWELDRGGPADRCHAVRMYPDFLFPQMQQPDLAPPDWKPFFTDYLYLSFTNAISFAASDITLTRWAKTMMMLQSAVSVAAIALVIARAVNIIG